jgi:hypothetical protein
VVVIILEKHPASILAGHLKTQAIYFSSTLAPIFGTYIIHNLSFIPISLHVVRNLKCVIVVCTMKKILASEIKFIICVIIGMKPFCQLFHAVTFVCNGGSSTIRKPFNPLELVTLYTK